MNLEDGAAITVSWLRGVGITDSTVDQWIFLLVVRNVSNKIFGGFRGFHDGFGSFNVKLTSGFLFLETFDLLLV